MLELIVHLHMKFDFDKIRLGHDSFLQFKDFNLSFGSVFNSIIACLCSCENLE